MNIKKRFQILDGKRAGHLNKQRECASLTIPSLLPPLGWDENSSLESPWQSLAARGVNNLASKLLLVLLPPNTSMCRLEPPTDVEEEAEASQQAQRAKTKLVQALERLESKIAKRIERLHLRVPLYRALKLLIVTGNALCYFPKSGGMRVFAIDNYVVSRDAQGNPVEIIARESVDPVTLSEEVRRLAKVELKEDEDNKDVEIFTRLLRHPYGWSLTQEINDEVVLDEPEAYDLNKMAWIPLRWSDNTGGNYGTGLVEENFGDLAALESLSKSVILGSKALSMLLFLVNPNGVTDIESLVDAEDTMFVAGNPEDVGCLQANKFADFQVAAATRNELIESLSRAFLMRTSIQRDAERVTAEEIRFMAAELDDAQGGVYSLLAQELQMPLIKWVIAMMQEDGDFPILPDGALEPVIITGVEALGRGHDLTKLGAFLQHIQFFGPDILKKYLVLADYFDRVATSLSLNITGLIRNEEEVINMEQYEMFQQVLAQIGPDAMNQILSGTMGMIQNQQQANLAAPAAQ